jgi:flavin prenyltransferase
MKRIIVGITGATGVIYGIRLLEVLKDSELETHLILSDSGKKNILIETDRTVESVERLAHKVYGVDDLGSSYFQRLLQDGRHGYRALHNENPFGRCPLL